MGLSRLWAVLFLVSSASSAQEPKKSTLSIPVEKGGEFIPPKAVLVEDLPEAPAGINGSLEVQSKMAKKIWEIQASAPTSAPTTVPLDAIMHVPFGRPVVWRPGFVNSPSAKPNQFVDVTGLPAGMEVKCPYTGKLFRVPAVDTQLTDTQPKQVGGLLQLNLTLDELLKNQTVLINQLTRNSGDQKEMLQIIKALYDVTERILGLEEKEKNEKPKQ